MSHPHTNLGLCYSANQLYYAVNDPSTSGRLAHIGSVDFNFNVSRAIVTRDTRLFAGIQKVISNIQDEYNPAHVRILSPPLFECWTTFPKLVYDKADEREAHLGILMKGIDRKDIEPIWYSISNQDYKFLVVRNQQVMQGFEKLTSSIGSAEYVSDFELGQRWISHADVRGSFLTISCYDHLICVASFLLGKLRAATYIKFEDIEDLPYLWLQNAHYLSWMKGLHEQIYVYGLHAGSVIDLLGPYWDQDAEINKMDALDNIQVEADDATYGFNLEHALPAILLALELSGD